MSTTGYLYHADCVRHETGPGHPERPARLESIHGHFQKTGILDDVEVLEPTEVDPALLARVHSEEHVRRVQRVCASAPAALDGDTPVGPSSWRAALLSAGGVVDAVDRVMEGRWRQGFVCSRPPGHHAEHDAAMGFCLFNNVAVAAQWLRDHHGLERVAIVDWDVHHGNGTQHIFERDPSVFYVSLHQYPHYPGTGAATERGLDEGEGATLNCPLSSRTGDPEWLSAMESAVLPALDEFRPEFVLVSAGFDAHRDDPLSGTRVTEDGYAQMTRLLQDLAARHAGGRFVSLLEGGYDLDALARSAHVHLSTLRENG